MWIHDVSNRREDKKLEGSIRSTNVETSDCVNIMVAGADQELLSINELAPWHSGHRMYYLRGSGT